MSEKAPPLPMPEIGRISGEFKDRKLEHEFRTARLEDTLWRVRAVCWVLIVATFLVILTIWQTHGLSLRFFEISAIRGIYLVFAVALLVYSYRTTSYRILDNSVAILCVALIVLALILGAYADPGKFSLIARNLMAVSLAYLIMPTRLPFIAIYALTLTIILIGQVLLLHEFSVQETTAALVCAILINFTGYLVVRDNAKGRRITYVLGRRAEAYAAAAETARQAAERADRSKSEYLAGLNHELRTPLNAVIGFGELLQRDQDETTNDRQRESVEHIITAGRHMTDIADQVLDLARMETGRIELTSDPIDTALMVKSSTGLIESEAEARGISVEAVVPEPAPVAYADPVRAKQVLLNLLSNAIKYNRQNGNVRVAVMNADNAVRFEVADTGEGVPAERHDELFEPFNRLDAGSSNVKGSGIGLSIARTIVEAMGGRLGVDSTVGEGSTFWFELPAAQEA